MTREQRRWQLEFEVLKLALRVHGSGLHLEVDTMFHDDDEDREATARSRLTDEEGIWYEDIRYVGENTGAVLESLRHLLKVLKNDWKAQKFSVPLREKIRQRFYRKLEKATAGQVPASSWEGA